jgi:transmembrane sensor
MNTWQDIFETAAQWHVASVHDDMDWDGLTAWLEADSAHRRAYDEIALVDALIDEHRPALRADIVPARPSRRPRLFAILGTAIAACLVAMIALPSLMSTPQALFETQAIGRHIALADGSKIELGPRSRLVIEGKRQDRLAVTGGAYFSITHDPNRPMTIVAGPVELRDIGTRFDVQADALSARVDVADGRLTATSAGMARPLVLTKGRALRFDGSAGLARMATIQPESVGGWRTGHLHYDNVPLPLVATDLERYAGVRVTVSASLRNRNFSGSLAASDGQAAARDLADLMGLALRPAGGGFVLEPAGR